MVLVAIAIFSRARNLYMVTKDMGPWSQECVCVNDEEETDSAREQRGDAPYIRVYYIIHTGCTCGRQYSLNEAD